MIGDLLTVLEHDWVRTNRVGLSRCGRCGFEFDARADPPEKMRDRGPCWTLPVVDPSRSYDYHRALQATLLFHSASPWDAEKRMRWLELTGSSEATTRALCDAVRRALG